MRIARLILLFALVAGILAMAAPSQAQIAVGLSIHIGPPALPVYAQPICPGAGYIWAPGYWAYGPDGYFWVPGTWVLAPEPGLLWTPGYWGFAGGVYVWHAGYWGPHVGFYGGINYGFGYTGVGFVGGYWRGGNYFYNRSVTNVNVTVIHNTYNTTVVNNTTINRVSFNGGEGGIHARPTREELAFEHEHHVSMTAEQNHHFEAARGDRRFLASENHGRPEVAASARSGEFRGASVEHAREASMSRPPENRGNSNRADRSGNNGRIRDDRPPSAQNARVDEKHQQQTEKMQRQQDAERQKMQQRHGQERQNLSHQNANQQKQDQLERRQQQQTDQMNRRHEQQSQKLDQRQQHESQRQEGKPHKQ